jgi:hypothetical protein
MLLNSFFSEPEPIVVDAYNTITGEIARDVTHFFW